MEVSAAPLANLTNECPPQVEPLLGNNMVAKAAADSSVIPVGRYGAENVDKDENTPRQSQNIQQPQTDQPGLHNVQEISIPAAPVQSNKSVGKYRLLRTIGKGNFAKVKLAIHIATGVEVAIKIVNKTALDGQFLKRLKREVNIMKITNHPNIVKLLEVIENEDVMCLVMEYASGGEIFDYLVANGRMREKDARVKFRQILSAIQYCHAKRIVHRDLKAENILLDHNLNVKVADFGLANTFEADQRLHTFCGSPPYAAPELFLGVPYYGPGVDVWSLGVLLFSLVIGQLPFDGNDLRELRSKVIGLHYTIPRGAVSPECETLLRKMLVLDPKNRSSLKGLMQDKWVNTSFEQDVLRPYREPPRLDLDEERVKIMESLGYTKSELESSVVNPEFDHVYATYHLIPEAVTLTSDASLTDSLSPAGAGKDISEIGRFTVAPSSVVTEARSPQAQQQPAARIGVDPAVRQAVEAAALREHHSLTSTLPIALRRAFQQMGRTFAGTGGAAAAVVSATSAVPAEPAARAAGSIPSGRSSAKSAQKTNGRNVVTAAPVPMVTSKKSQLTSSSGKHVASAGPLGPGGRLSDTPVTVKPHTSPPIVTTPFQAAPPVRQDSGKKTPKSSPSSRSQASSQRSTHVPMAPLAEDSGPPTTVISVTPVEDKAPLVSPALAAILPDSKSISSSSTSSDSHGEAASRQQRSVQEIWHAGSLTDAHGQPSASPATTQSTRPVDLTTPQPVVTANLTPSSLNEGQAIVQRNSSKIAHTVQDGEAKALQCDLLRMQLETSSPATRSPMHTYDGAHGNTWSRGVFKAFGGLFGPTHAHKKPTEQLSASPQPSVRTPVGPRVVRFPSSVNTTSSKTAEELLTCVVTALESTQGCRYAYNAQMPFLLRCSWASNRPAIRPVASSSDNNPTSTATSTPAANTTAAPPVPVHSMFGSPGHCGERDDPVHFEMEVCQVPRLHLRGVRVKRIRGSAIQFRQVADSIMKVLRL